MKTDKDKTYKEQFRVTHKLLQTALTKNEKYQAALKFYAEEENWRNRNCSLFDQGATARAVLK